MAWMGYKNHVVFMVCFLYIQIPATDEFNSHSLWYGQSFRNTVSEQPFHARVVRPGTCQAMQNSLACNNIAFLLHGLDEVLTQDMEMFDFLIPGAP